MALAAQFERLLRRQLGQVRHFRGRHISRAHRSGVFVSLHVA